MKPRSFSDLFSVVRAVAAWFILCVVGPAFATTTITSATLDGSVYNIGSPYTVAVGQVINACLTVDYSGSGNWKSNGVQFGTATPASNSWNTATNCANNSGTPVSAASYTQCVSTTVQPSPTGTQNAYFGTFTNVACGGNGDSLTWVSAIVVQAVSAARSTVSASLASVPADGSTTSTITVTLKNGAGAAVSGKTVTLAAGSGSSTITTVSGTTNGSGVATFTVKDSVAEAVTYTATDATDGITLTMTPTVTFSAVVSSFNAFETTTALGAITGVIKTKIAGSVFSLDVVAIASGIQATGFSGNVKVELLANTGTVGSGYDVVNHCPTSTSVIQTIASTAISGGRSLVNFAAVADAYRDVRVRISDPTASPTITICSTDSFAIRPNSLSVSVTDTDWQTAGPARALNNSGATGGNVHKAGQPFTLKATAYNAATTPATTAGYSLDYNVSPPVQTVACSLPTPTCTPGTLTPGTWTTAGGKVTSSTAKYSEVGSFQLTLEDRNFASVDAGDTPATCAGYYVCSDAVSVGRFVPDHFEIAASNTPQFKTFNDAACTSRSFTYLGQPFGYVTAPQILVTAKNASSTTTTNYTGNLWKLLALAAGAQDCTTNPDICTLSSGSVTQTYTYTTSPSATPNWDSTQVALATPAMVAGTIAAGTGGTGTVTSDSTDQLAFKRSSTTPQALFTAAITLTESVKDTSEYTAAGVGNCGVAGAGGCDITTPTPVGFNPVAFDSGSEFRYGRLRMLNAYGSELLALTWPQWLVTQYWSASGWAINTADRCTSLAVPAPAPGSGMVFGSGNLSAGKTVASVNGATTSTGTVAAGDARFSLTRPGAGNRGYVDITIAAPTWLTFPWKGSAATGPTGRATFGIYKSPLIYRRENY